jgi:hypothetical protein
LELHKDKKFGRAINCRLPALLWNDLSHLVDLGLPTM